MDGRRYSPTVLHRILHIAGSASSFAAAAESLQILSELSISIRQINKLTKELGGQLAEQRDVRVQQFVDPPLPRQTTAPATPIDLAAVFVDGGRMRTRTPRQGPGVHQPHWRETKNAALHRMSSETFSRDPQPELPDCFRNQKYVEKLVHGLKGQKKEAPVEESPPEETAADGTPPAPPKPSWPPKPLFRTCLSSLVNSDKFGAMLAAAADARGFFQGRKRAFVGDGQTYNWSIQQRWFPDFTPIVDFVHGVEYLYDAAKAMHADLNARWSCYLNWATACWQGRVAEVVEQLTAWQAPQALAADSASADSPPAAPAAPSEAEKTIASTITYLDNHRDRMQYPSDRCAGLPVTSSLAESFVKQVNRRVKGTEKFWDDGEPGEAILQIRTAVLSDGQVLADFLTTRPISPFAPRCRPTPLTTAA